MPSTYTLLVDEGVTVPYDLRHFEEAVMFSEHYEIPTATVKRESLSELITEFKSFEFYAGTSKKFLDFLKDHLGEAAFNLYWAEFERQEEST